MLVGLPFLKRAAILNPSSVGELGKDRAVRRFTRLVHQLAAMKILKNDEGDKSINQYNDLLSCLSTRTLFDQFQPSQRLDDFYFQTLEIANIYPELTRVLEVVFVMHNGQADVERGFSLNKDLITTNMGELTIKSRRMIKDHLRANGLKPTTVNLTSPLLKSVKSARSQYMAHLEEQRCQKRTDDECFDNDNIALKKVTTKRANLEKLLKSLHEDCMKINADAYEQPDFTRMKSELEKGKAVKRKADQIEAQIEALDKQISGLQKRKK